VPHQNRLQGLEGIQSLVSPAIAGISETPPKKAQLQWQVLCRLLRIEAELVDRSKCIERHFRLHSRTVHRALSIELSDLSKKAYATLNTPGECGSRNCNQDRDHVLECLVGVWVARMHPETGGRDCRKVKENKEHRDAKREMVHWRVPPGQVASTAIPLLGRQALPDPRIIHMWTAPACKGFERRFGELVGCGHM